MFLVDNLVEDLRKAFACFCCLLCFGPLLFAIGIWQFAGAPGATKARNTMIASVNQQIDVWNNVEPQWAASTWSVNTYHLPLVHPSNEIPTVENLQSYTASYFASSIATNVIPPQRFNESALPVVVNFQASGSNSTGGTIVTVKLFQTRTDLVRGYGQCPNGDYVSGKCTNYYVLDSVCVKVQKSQSTNVYSGSNSYGGYGCGEGTDFAGQWSPSIYRQVDYPVGNQLFYFNDFTVKNAQDPYIYYLYEGGSWPLTTGQRLMIGTVLMIIGGLFMVPCILFIVIGVVCFRRKRHHHHHHEENRLIYS